ncbi:MAG: tetratricopeptide repeat protein [Bacteroidota bacterium]
MDELGEVNDFINSQKAQETDIHADLQPDLNVQVMGIGLTLNSFTYHLRKILGKENRAISGELTDIDHKLKLTVRVSSNEPVTIEERYIDGKREDALMKLFHEGAKDIMGKMDPYRMAVYHYKKEDYETSMKYIMRVLNERPNEQHWAYLAWSSWLNRQGRMEESMEKLHQALAVEKNFSVALINLGWGYFTQKDYENALQTFKHLNEVDPSISSAWNGRALCHGILGETEEAEKCYAMAVKQNPLSIAWYGNWAWFRYSTMKDTMGAVQIFEKAKQHLPESPELYMSIGGTYTYRNDLDSAALFAQRAYDMDPYNAVTLQSMMNIFYRQADYAKSEEFNLKYIRTLESDRYRNQGDLEYQLQRGYNSLAMCKYQRMQYDSALHYVNIAIDLFPTIGYPYSTLAETYAYMGEHEKFYEAVEKGIQHDFNFLEYVNQEPYSRYANDPRFQKLVKKDIEMAMKD